MHLQVCNLHENSLRPYHQEIESIAMREEKIKKPMNLPQNFLEALVIHFLSNFTNDFIVFHQGSPSKNKGSFS